MRINPYLFFDGRCEEAFRYYEKVLGAKVEHLMPYGEHAKTHPAKNLENKIIHGAIRIGESVVMASDDGMGYKTPQGFRVSVTMKTPAEAERAFAGLSDGGDVTMPMQQTFFSPRFGMLTDKFGIPWMVTCEQQG